MAESVLPTHEALLQLCASSAPEPWYPKLYAEQSGVRRDSLDAPLNDLRIAGLVRLTEWLPGRGQGYQLTSSGDEVLKNPVALARFRTQIQSGPPKPIETVIPLRVRKPVSRYDRGEAARKALYEPQPARVVPILIALNFAAFGLSYYFAVDAGVSASEFASRGNGPAMHKAGALSPIDLVHGEWWRLFTCCFLHFGLLHLLLNMYCLYALSRVESLWGPWRFLLVYLASGVGGSAVAMFYYSPLKPVLLAGASGAIWGMMTSLVAWLLMNRSHLPPREYAAWVQQMSVIFLINVGVSFMPGISAAAHFGGGVVGFLMAILLHVHRFAVGPRQLASLLLIVMLPVLVVYALVTKVKEDSQWQELREKERDARRKLGQDDLLTMVTRAEAAAERVLAPAFVLTDQPPEARDPDSVKLLQDEIRHAESLVQAAAKKLGEKPEDERLQRICLAGCVYMQTLQQVLGRLQELLANGDVWKPRERTFMESLRKHAWREWAEARKEISGGVNQ